MKKWQIESSETLEISEILFQVFLFPSFRFCPIAKIENSDLEILEKNVRVFRDFRVFDLAVLEETKFEVDTTSIILSYMQIKKYLDTVNLQHTKPCKRKAT